METKLMVWSITEDITYETHDHGNVELVPT